MQTKILKSIALATAILAGAFLTMFAVSKIDKKEDTKKESVELASDNQNYYSITRVNLKDDSIDSAYTASVDNVLEMKKYAYSKKVERLKTAKRLDKEAEEKRLAEIAKAEAEKKAKEEAERKRQEELNKEREQRRTERQVAQAEKSDVVSRGDSYKGQWRTFEATYYGPDCVGCSGITATSIDVRNTIYHNGMRVVAVDPNVIPLGSVVEVQTPHETFTAYAGDTGGAIKGSRVDILVESEAVSSQCGRHSVQLRVLSKP